MGQPICRLGDSSNHGGVIISASSDMLVDGIPVARLGDWHSCPIPGHGITPIISASVTVDNDNMGLARIGSTTGCGAVLTTGSPTSICD